MKVILREHIAKLGDPGDIVTVADGYGRNYLIPKGFAVPVARGSVESMIDHHRQQIEHRRVKRARDAVAMAQRLESISLNISRRVSEDEKLYGSVTPTDVAKALAEEGIDIDRHTIVMDEPIKQLGVYTLTINLAQDVSARLKVWVTREA